MSSPTPWERVFQCQRCGACCTGLGGIVTGPADVTRLADFLACSSETLTRKYLERRNGKLYIKNGEDGNCVFFSAQAGCTAHAAKPAICRAWPFFRGNLLDAYSLALAREYCPGIDKSVSHAEFQRAGRACLDFFGLMAKDPENEANALILTASTGENA